MSTIAARISSASTRVKVGTAAVAVVAAATITPAIAEASPAFAPVAQSIGSSVTSELSSLPAVPTGLNAAVDTAGAAAVGAISDFNPIQFIWTNIVQPIAGWFYQVGEFVVGLAATALNEFARIFRVGPYGTAG